MKKSPLFLFVLLFLVSTAAMAQDTTAFKEFTGTYKFPSGTVIPEAIVTLENGVLTMSSAEGTSTLEKIKGDSFNIVSFSGIAVFKRNDAKKINAVHIEASGYVFDGVKDPAPFSFANKDFAIVIPVTNLQDEKTINFTKEAVMKKRFSYPRAADKILQ